MPKQESCKVTDRKDFKLSYHPKRNKLYKLTIRSKFISSTAKPGQFVTIRCASSYDPLLRRPISIHNVSPKKGTFDMLFEVLNVGARDNPGIGSSLLSKKTVGQELDVIGPLGTGFDINKCEETAILVGGGIGVAPLLLLARELRKKKKRVFVLIGAYKKDVASIYKNEFKGIADKTLVSTDDGSLGVKGNVSVLLNTRITDGSTGSPFQSSREESRDYELRNSTIYACGPRAMLKVVANFARKSNVPCQLSMEAYMACGIGTCMGCVVKTVNGYKKVCDDGPVFDAKEIIWD